MGWLSEEENWETNLRHIKNGTDRKNNTLFSEKLLEVLPDYNNTDIYGLRIGGDINDPEGNHLEKAIVARFILEANYDHQTLRNAARWHFYLINELWKHHNSDKTVNALKWWTNNSRKTSYIWGTDHVPSVTNMDVSDIDKAIDQRGWLKDRGIRQHYVEWGKKIGWQRFKDKYGTIKIDDTSEIEGLLNRQKNREEENNIDTELDGKKEKSIVDDLKNISNTKIAGISIPVLILIIGIITTIVINEIKNNKNK